MQIEQGGQGTSMDPSMEEFKAKLAESGRIQAGVRSIVEYRRPTNQVDLRAQSFDPDDPRARELLEKLEGLGVPVGESRDRMDRDLFYAESQYLEMHKDLKRLVDEKNEDKRVEIRERLKIHKERLMEVQLDLIDGILEDNCMRFRSSYPYDGRTAGMFFDSMRKVIRATEREDWATRDREGNWENPEVGAWLDVVYKDCDWLENNFRVLESSGVNLPQFYSGMNMLGWVSARGGRTDATAEYYQHAYAKEVPGLEVDKEAAERTGVEIMREKAIKYQDDAAFWRMAVAEVQQMELLEGGAVKPSMMVKGGERVLSDAEIKFIRLVFDEKQDESGWVNYKGHEVPKGLLNWYTMGESLRNRKRYLATMEVLLMMGVKDSLAGASDEKVKHLAELVKVYLYGGDKNLPVKNRLGKWNRRDKPLDLRLASVVVKSGIVSDWGHMSCGRLGWGYEYEEKNGKVTRKVDGGGTTVATDIGTPRYWFNTEAKNRKKNWTTGMMPPMSKEFMREVLRRGYGWQPPENETLIRITGNGDLQKMWDRLWTPIPDEDQKTRELKKKMEGMVWFWETPYKGKSGKPLVVPMFFPAEIKSLNFWDTIKLGGGDKSVWDELMEGGKMSEVNWENMGQQALYRWMITISQTLKLLTVMTEPEKKGTNDGQFADFFGSPSQLTELIKRGDLGVRDEDTEAVLLIMGLLPMLVVMKQVGFNKLYGDVLSGSYKKEKVQEWLVRVAEWIPAFEDLADEKGSFKGYNEMMKRVYLFYVSVFTQIGLAAGEVENRRTQTTIEDTVSTVGSDLGIRIEPRKKPDAGKLPEMR